MSKESPASIAYLQNLKQLLEIERNEDAKQFKEEFLRADVNKRRENGVTWFPVVLLNEEPTLSNHLLLEVERTSYLDKPHQFSAGKNVIFFSNKNNETQEINGTIKTVHRNSMKVILHCEDLPDWAYEGRLGINLQFDDLSYAEMDFALNRVITAKENRIAELREIFHGKELPAFEAIDESIVLPGLNLSQNRAVRKVLAAKDVAVIHGPPGTGKTTTLVQAIRLTLQKEKQVLVCAPTNTAVDLLSEKLLEQGVEVLRIGNPARVSEDLLSSTLDGKIMSSPYYKDIKSLRKSAEEYFKMASKYKRTFGREEAEQRAMYYTEAKNCVKEANLLEDYITSQQLEGAQVITCTPVTASSRYLRDKKFNTLFFDEASQALEPMTWVALNKCNRIILAGDHFQLPPVVKSREAEKGGLKITLLERCMVQSAISVLLNVQYRMHNAIMEFSNEVFYNNELQADITVKDAVLSLDENFPKLNAALDFVDTAGCGFDEQQNPETLSLYNTEEAGIVWKHLKLLIEQYKASNKGVLDISIGIIAPYKSHIELLKEQLPEMITNEEDLKHIAIKTIDGFQGEERDVIYISFVRSNTEGEIGFLSDIRRTNVALTRARKKLVMVGDSATLANNEFYKKLVDFCERKESYSSAWEYISME
ncbi:MAG: DNA-binding protein [Bacteroidetes bacterium]|jgi:predicted DNA helicase|nr:DNA-binding protein [Bacteroidota bacterium]